MTAEPEKTAPDPTAADATFGKEEGTFNPLFTSSPDAMVDQLQADLKKSQDELLRQQAEFENFRKRKQRERNAATQSCRLPAICCLSWITSIGPWRPRARPAT